MKVTNKQGNYSEITLTTQFNNFLEMNPTIKFSYDIQKDDVAALTTKLGSNQAVLLAEVTDSIIELIETSIVSVVLRSEPLHLMPDEDAKAVRTLLTYGLLNAGLTLNTDDNTGWSANKLDAMDCVEAVSTLLKTDPQDYDGIGHSTHLLYRTLKKSLHAVLDNNPNGNLTDVVLDLGKRYASDSVRPFVLAHPIKTS